MFKTIRYINEHIAVKSILSIISLLVLFSLVVCIIGFKAFTSSLLEVYSEDAFRTADTAVLMVDGDRIQAYHESGGTTEEYQNVYQRLDSLCNSSRSTFIYVIDPDRTDYRHITFLFSTMRAGSGYTKYDFGYYRETTNDDYREKYRNIMEGTSKGELVVRDKGYIETDPHITVMVPVIGTDGKAKAILCVQRQMESVIITRQGYLSRIVFVTMMAALLVLMTQGRYLERVFLTPVDAITKEASRFASENIPAEEKLSSRIKNTDEIGILASSIDRMEEQISRYVENITSITAENERIGTELTLATRIQLSMIPHEFPPFPERTDIDIFAVMDPAKEVGGDFYDFFLIDDDHLGLIMADVSGKGIPAALFMMASKIILQSVAMLGGSPAEILTRTNEAICSNNQAEMFVTVWAGILELSTGKLTAANAGHEYPIFRKPDGQFEIFKDKHGFVIGGMEGMKYTEYEMQLEPGTKIFVYTDGAPEASDADNRMFGMQRLIDALNSDPQASPKQLLENVRAAVDRFVDGAEQFDDLTMMCVEYKG